jgi:putative FmdB family regulatory protein
MPTYSYKCPDGHYHDEWKSITDRHTDECPECGQEGRLVVTKPTALDNYNMGLSPSNPTAYDKWAKMQQQKGQEEAKSYRDNGDYGSNYAEWHRDKRDSRNH